jgi:hypothetical protein
MLSMPALVMAQDAGSSRVSKEAPAETTTLVVSRPTVIAYLVVPAGAVDTSDSLAVLADDWNVAMATLGDSLAARGIFFALVTQARLRVRMAGRRDVLLALDVEPTAGYVYARPGMTPCVRRGALEIDEVLRATRALVDRRMSAEARTRAMCGARRR